MLTTATLAFWLIACLAAWMQTLTGFALGLILMGGVGLLGLMPLPEAAVVTSILVVTNGAIVLWRGWREVDGAALRLYLAGTLPTLIIGYALLHYLAGTALWLLQLLLGLVIVGSSIQLGLRPRPQEHRSPPASFIAFGAAGGIMGGLFSTAGPPIIYHIYRQPIAQTAIRSTLVAIFVLNQTFRLGLVVATDGIALPTLAAAAGAIPAVALGTLAARRWPPPLTPARMRQLAVGLLFCSGAALVGPALTRLAG